MRENLTFFFISVQYIFASDFWNQIRILMVRMGSKQGGKNYPEQVSRKSCQFRTYNGGNNESGCGLCPRLSFMSKDPELIRWSIPGSWKSKLGLEKKETSRCARRSFSSGNSATYLKSAEPAPLPTRCVYRPFSSGAVTKVIIEILEVKRMYIVHADER